jgi:hypothetical protein
MNRHLVNAHRILNAFADDPNEIGKRDFLYGILEALLGIAEILDTADDRDHPDAPRD